MPCSKCSKSGHNIRTCPIKNKRRRLGSSVVLEPNDEIKKMKKQIKKLQKRSRRRLNECRELESALAVLYDETEEKTETISQQQKHIEEKDETIQKLRNGESDMCNICFEPVPPGAENKTDCGHTFHCGCLLKWLKTKNTCPCCRTELYEKSEPNLNDDFDRVLGDALVDLYSQSITDDPEMQSLLEFGNYIIEGVFPELDEEMPTMDTVTEYINEMYTDDEESAIVETDNDDDDDGSWVRILESSGNIFYIHSITGEIRDDPPASSPPPPPSSLLEIAEMTETVSSGIRV